MSTKQKPQCGYEMVTPGQAQTWLDKPAKNRKLSQRRIELYAAMMLRGDWMLTNQGIAIDEFGSLLDGQHRLSAIVKADKAIELLVIRATPNRSQLVIDQGMARRPHDQVGLREGWEITPLHMAIAKVMMLSVGGPGAGQRKKDMSDIILIDRYYVRHHKAIEWTYAQFAKHASVRGVTIAPAIAPVARAHYRFDVNQLQRFCEVLATGMAERKGDSPAIVLRNWLIAGREKQLSARTGKDRYEVYKKAEIALKAFLEGSQIERLGSRQLDTELFPIPGDVPIRVIKKAA